MEHIMMAHGLRHRPNNTEDMRRIAEELTLIPTGAFLEALFIKCVNRNLGVMETTPFYSVITLHKFREGERKFLRLMVMIHDMPGVIPKAITGAAMGEHLDLLRHLVDGYYNCIYDPIPETVCIWALLHHNHEMLEYAIESRLYIIADNRLPIPERESAIELLRGPLEQYAHRLLILGT